MALYNAFAALALDQSVMSTTPLLKQINTSILSTPWVYVVNPQQNIYVLNQATPPAVQSVSLGSATPVVSILNTNVGINNWPATFTTQGVVNVNVANVATPFILATPSVVAWQGSAVWNTSVSNFPATYPTQGVVNINWATQATPVIVSLQATPVVSAIITNMPPVVLPAVPMQNVNFASQATPVTVSFNNTPGQATPIVSAVISSMPGVTVAAPAMQNINFAQQATPVQVTIIGPSTPIVSLANTQVAVQNFPATYPTQGVVNVNVANVATPFILATPITYAYQPYPYAVNVLNFATPQFVLLEGTTTPIQTYTTGTVSVGNLPGVQNVNIANVATPFILATPSVIAYQGSANWNVSITSTPVVSILNTNVAVNNLPATYPTQGVVNVNVANQTTPAPTQQVFFGGTFATPAVTAYQGNALWNTTLLSTPIVAITPSSITLGAQNSIKSQAIYQSGQMSTDSSGAYQTVQDIGINVNSVGSATPLVLAASRQIRVLNYVISTSAACTVTFTTTPIVRAPNITLQGTVGLPQSLINTAIQGGPYYMAANGAVVFSGNLLGEAFIVPAGTPLYIQASTGAVGGHLVYVYV